MKNKKIALFFGGKVSRHLKLLKEAAKKLKVNLDLISYNQVCFDTESNLIKIRKSKNAELGERKWINIENYDVFFFRTTGKHWEEVNLILDSVKNPLSLRDISLEKGDLNLKRPIIVDPLVEKGRPSDACKAYQMLELKKAGIDVPKTVYGSLWYIYEFMRRQSIFLGAHTNTDRVEAALQKNTYVSSFIFPVIIKGSGGDRGTRVFKADSLEELEKLVRKLRKSETEEGKRYMLQEYIPNDGDYRVLVLGEKVLGVMKRSSQNKTEFRNNYSAGGKVEIADLPEDIKKLAVKAANVCGLMVAGVDVAFRDYDVKKPIIWEVNKGPQFKGFMEATGIDVPSEMVKFLANLKK
jgi:RimK family alpha-L-glutamate ligase